MSKRIPLSVPNISKSAIGLVSEAVDTEWVSTGGPFIERFEEVFAAYAGTEKAVALQSGTAAIHLSLIQAGVGRGDAVIVPTLTFIAAVNPVAYQGAHPIFMDCDDSLTMDPLKLKKYLKEETVRDNGQLCDRSSLRPIKAILVVHVFGNLADMKVIMKLADEYGLPVIEDATEAIGSRDENGQMAGTFAQFGAYSFNGNKIITTGGGGMAVALDAKALSHIRSLSTQAKRDALYYLHDEVGYNYRMTNLQAAVGLSQMEDLERFIRVKQANYENYREAIEKIPGLRLLPFRENTRSNHWFYALYVEDSFGCSRDAVIEGLKARNIESRPIWGLIHEQRPYRHEVSFLIEKASDYHDHVVNIPCSTNLSSDDVETVIRALKELSC